jgi:hypothetical protein
MKRQKKAKPTFVSLICGQLQLLRALKQAQCNVTAIPRRHRGISNRLPIGITEYARNMNETVGEGEANPRDSYMWPADCVICPRRYSQDKRASCGETRLSVRNSISATTLFLGFS